MVQNLKWATAHLSRVAGLSAQGAGRAQAGAGRAAGCAGRGAGVRRRGRTGWRAWGAQAGAQGAGRARACWASGRRLATGAGVQAGVRQQARGHDRDARGIRGRAQQQARARAERAGQGWLGGRRATWARGLALGSALSALGPFSIRFDSFFS